MQISFTSNLMQGKGFEHQFTGKKHRFYPVEDVGMQGTRL